MIKIVENETLYSATLILMVNETAVITDPVLPGSVIEITVKEGQSSEPGLAPNGLNAAKLTVYTGQGPSTAGFGLHTPDGRLLNGRIVSHTILNMTRFDIQVSDSGARFN